MKSRLTGLCLTILLGIALNAWAAETDYAQDVAIQSNPSPVDVVTGSSINQFTAGQTNSQVDSYLFQDEQINLDEASGVVKVLRTNQKANLNNYVTTIIPLKHAAPRELRGLARTICRKEGGDADVLQDKVSKKNYLAVVCPSFQLPYLRDTLTALDESWVQETNNGAWFVYYKGQYRDVHNMMDILQVYRSPDGVWDFDDPNNAVLFSDQPNVRPLWEMGTKSVDIPPSQLVMDVAMYEVDTQNDLNMGFDFASWKNGPGRNLFEAVLWDFDGELGPSLFPGDAPARTSDWGRFLSYNFTVTSAYIDFLQSKGRARLVKKATIAAKSGTVAEIAELDQIAAFASNSSSTPVNLTSSAPLKLGSLYKFLYDSRVTTISLDDLLRMPPADLINQVDAVLTSISTSAAIRDQVRKELTDAASDGRITFAEMERIYVPSSLILDVFHARTMNYLKSGQVGMLVSILPVVGLESAEVSIAMDASDVNGFTPAGSPIIEHRYVASTVEVRDGQPMALGGLRRTIKTNTGSGIPFLRDIPYAGNLFGHNTTIKREKEMVVLLIPRFRLCPTSETAAPPEQVAALKLAQGEDVLKVPNTPFGFDQWMLDSGK